MNEFILAANAPATVSIRVSGDGSGPCSTRIICCAATFAKTVLSPNTIEQIKFRQLTDRGYIFCRAEVPIGICNRCSSKHWNKDAEAIVDDIVRQEYEKLRACKLIVSATAER